MCPLVLKAERPIPDVVKTCRPIPIWFEIFIIFIIKSNPICVNNNPKLQNFFKKSEVAPK